MPNLSDNNLLITKRLAPVSAKATIDTLLLTIPYE